jgi:hypothetical protein
MKVPLLLAASLAGLALSGPAHAAPADKHGRMGVDLLLSPFGSGRVDDGESPSLGVSYGFRGLVAGEISRYVTIGLSPRVLFGLRFDGDDNRQGENETFSELDVALRITGHLPLASGGAELQIHAAPGYSWLLVPEDPDAIIEYPEPSGFVLGVGAGVAVPVSEHLLVVGDVGYTFGFHRMEFEISDQRIDRGIGVNTLHLGIGLQAKL